MSRNETSHLKIYVLLWQFKPVSLSSSGVMKLESDVHYVLNLVKTTPVSAEDILSSPIVLNLRFVFLNTCLNPDWNLFTWSFLKINIVWSA